MIEVAPTETRRLAPVPASVVPPATRRVGRDGWISVARNRYAVGRRLAGETVEVVTGNSLVEIFHRGVLVVSHVARHDHEAKIVGRVPLNPTSRRRRRGRTALPTPPVTRLVDRAGQISFAGRSYRAGKGLAGRSVEVVVADGAVEISLDGRLLEAHPVRHDPNERARRPSQSAGPAAQGTKRRLATESFQHRRSH